MSPVATATLIRAKLSQRSSFFIPHCLVTCHCRYNAVTAVLLIDSPLLWISLKSVLFSISPVCRMISMIMGRKGFFFFFQRTNLYSIYTTYWEENVIFIMLKVAVQLYYTQCSSIKQWAYCVLCYCTVITSQLNFSTDYINYMSTVLFGVRGIFHIDLVYVQCVHIWSLLARCRR